MSANPASHSRGEIWRVNFDPTLGSEIKKTRPAVVISSDAVGKLPVKLIVPMTNWDEAFAKNFWHIRIEPDSLNGLSKTSAADALQIRCADRQRFRRYRLQENRTRSPQGHVDDEPRVKTLPELPRRALWRSWPRRSPSGEADRCFRLGGQGSRSYRLS